MKQIYILLSLFLFISCSDKEEAIISNLSVSKEAFAAPYTGTAEVITISSSGSWSIQCDVSWVRFSATKGSGENLVTIIISANPDTEERSTTATVTDGTKNIPLEISQAGSIFSLAVSPLSATIVPEGNDFTIQVNAQNMEWEVEIPVTAQGWIRTSTQTATSVTFTVKLNNNKVKRNAELTVRQKNGTINKKVTISQEFFSSSMPNQTWVSIATSRPAAWYSSNEAKEVAENVLLYQKNAGGWPKNINMHLILTDIEKILIVSEKGSTESAKMACLDNDATTTEMRFLAKMFKYVKDERYKEAFGKGLDFLIGAQYPNAGNLNALPGGWPQYYPLRGGYSDRITFNDNLMTNILRLLGEVYKDSDDFADIVEEGVAEKAKASYDAGVKCILDCQVVVDGVKTFWGAQHDEYTLDPAVGRPHEHPSYSGAEGNDVLKFLMEIEEPSQEIKDAVVAAVAWLESVKIPNKKVVDVKSGSTTIDRVVQDSPGNDMWGRFIQLGGEVAERVYTKHFNDLKNSRRNAVIDGTTYSFNYSENARESYNPDYAYKPVHGIYDNDLGYLFYRFLYVFEDADNAVEGQHGLSLPILSLNALRRVSYQYLGNWPQNTIKTLYPAWRQKHGI
ncbi:pectate lyase [Bacteroides sp. UBA939]|uniref:pectate lyase n=1 Tax=Bacteroides sp. UBA939 TaxID=1946092 RepID=UPI0025BC05D5|nr:pectate lyase [Bacteroides sp. UBA939]